MECRRTGVLPFGLVQRVWDKSDGLKCALGYMDTMLAIKVASQRSGRLAYGIAEDAPWTAMLKLCLDFPASPTVEKYENRSRPLIARIWRE